MAPLTVKGKYIFLCVAALFFFLKFIGIFIGNWGPYNNIIDLLVYSLTMAILYFLINVDDISIGHYTTIPSGV
ncbi:unnamed protein product [Cunninghamella blakesleeana]